MELSPEAQAGLGLLANEESFPQPKLEAFVASVVEGLLRADAQGSFPAALSGVDPAHLKLAQLGLATLYLEAAKRAFDADVLLHALPPFSWSAAASSAITRAYEGARAGIRVRLGTFGFRAPRVVDVRWSLEWRVKSDSRDRVAHPVWSVTLVTQEESEADLHFECNEEQMQSLVLALEDAVGAVHRVVSK